MLALAEKIRPNTYIDVLEDPQSHSDAVIRDEKQPQTVFFLVCVIFHMLNVL